MNGIKKIRVKDETIDGLPIIDALIFIMHEILENVKEGKYVNDFTYKDDFWKIKIKRRKICHQLISTNYTTLKTMLKELV